MRHLNILKAALCSGFVTFGFVACTDSSSSISAPKGNEKQQSSGVVFDTVKTVDEQTGETIITIDTLQTKQDTVRHIDEKGDTVYVVEKIVIPKDTSLRWVGNSALVITEINPLNLDWRDEDGDDPSWVEIYNAGETSANLKGYSLVESLKDPRKFVFGDEIIAAKSFRIVFCDKKNFSATNKGTDSDSAHFRTHTNWRLDKDGGTVYLIDMNNGIRDSVVYPGVTPGVSWGIVDGGAWKYFEKPTPEAPNTQSQASESLDPDMKMDNIKPGFYSDPITINPPSVDAGVSIRCTQDGSEPTKSSQEFNSPITIDKNTSLRCAAYKEGAITKKVVTKTFFIGEHVTSKMPVVAVSVAPSFFDKYYVKTGASKPAEAPSGLYEDVEIPIHVEYFAEGGNSKDAAWGVDAGISLMGGYSRLNDKKSVAIRMREEYEDGKIEYPLFETRKGANDKYKAFNLRNNGNRFVSDYIEDAMGGALLEGSGIDYQRSRQVIVFYNGKYYGIHDMRERFNEAYVETNYGIDSRTVDIVKHLGDEITLTGGSMEGYKSMLSFVAQNDFSGANNENYATAKTLLDVGNFADYMAAEIYMHNGDWPNNNVRAWRSTDQPWKFMVYDLDHGFDWMWGVNGGEFDQHSKMFAWIKKGGGNKPCKEEGCFPNLYIQLSKNPDFQRMFINRSAVIFHDYTNGANVQKTVDAMVATIDPDEIERDLEHFHQNEKYYSNSCGDGFSKTGSCLKSWATERDSKVIDEYKEEFGVKDLISVSIKSDGPGEVMMEGMHLPKSTANSTNYSGKFFGGNDMELLAVAAEGSVFAGWSDGVKDNPRIVSPTDGSTFTASFK